jgi:hypothetical protein
MGAETTNAPGVQVARQVRILHLQIRNTPAFRVPPPRAGEILSKSCSLALDKKLAQVTNIINHFNIPTNNKKTDF